MNLAFNFWSGLLAALVCYLPPTFAFPQLKEKQLERSTAECPFNSVGYDLERANLQAKTRLEDFEAAFPTSVYGRKYTIGEANVGETYCDAINDQKYCNKIHGAWGDSIAQNGMYCAWVMLEFQDPPEYNFGISEANTSKFNGIFEATQNSLIALGAVEDKVVTLAASGGTASGDPNADGVIPWPIASIIWKNGNKHAKDWIANTHRPTSQDVGYSFGFTFRGHYKAVECDKIWPTLQANNLTRDNNFTMGGLFLGRGSFKNFWNAFSDMEDVSSQFLPTECIVECVTGPCPNKYGIAPTSQETTSGARLGFQRMAGLLTTLVNIAF